MDRAKLWSAKEMKNDRKDEKTQQKLRYPYCVYWRSKACRSGSNEGKGLVVARNFGNFRGSAFQETIHGNKCNEHWGSSAVLTKG